MRATASIVRARRFYSDEILNNFLKDILFFFSSYVLLSSSCLLLFFCFIFSLFSSYTGSFRLQSETALPVHCYGQIYKNIEKPKEDQGFFDFWGPEVEKDLK